MPMSFGVKTATKAELCVFEHTAFVQTLARDPLLHEEFQKDASAFVDHLHRRIADIGQRSACARLGQLLLELHQRHATRGLLENDGFEFPASQDLLAKALALTKAYVNRSLSKLKR